MESTSLTATPQMCAFKSCPRLLVCIMVILWGIFGSGLGALPSFAATLPTFSATASGTITNLTLTASIGIADADLGNNGNFYLVANTGSALFAHNGTTWEPWSGGPIPVFAVGSLINRSINVVSNTNLSTLIGTQVFVGYGLSESDMLTHNKYGLIYTVTETQLITPYVNETDIESIVQVFNSNGNSGSVYGSLGYVHDGLDIIPKGNLVPFQAVCSGRVEMVIETEENVVVFLVCDSTHAVEYCFEPQSPQAGAGQIQLANMAVVAGQVVSQGDIIGNLYVADSYAHVHFALHKNWVPRCPESYFDSSARNSILNLVHVNFPGADMCYGGDVIPPPLITPYVNESDMASINESFSSVNTTPPWGFVHNGIDFFPHGNLKPFRATCSGIVDSVQLWQNNSSSNWQVNLLIECNPYVPNSDGYFAPLTVSYAFEPMTSLQADGQTQLANISVVAGQSVSQGDIIGNLYAANSSAHVHFGLLAFGVPSIAICPETHFSSEAKNSILNLLHVAWPDANICYQE